jgi:hypothetical protein
VNPMIDYEKFILTAEERRYFERFKNEDQVILNNFTEYDLLYRKGLICPARDSEEEWIKFPIIGTISRIGAELREYRRGNADRKKKDFLKYFVTTIIASLGFLLSAINLLITLGVIPKP